MFCTVAKMPVNVKRGSGAAWREGPPCGKQDVKKPDLFDRITGLTGPSGGKAFYRFNPVILSTDF